MIPEGFEQYYTYETGFPETVDGVIARNGDLFDVEKVFPTLPFLIERQVYHVGWKIPTVIKVDSSKQCWADDALDSILTPRETGPFLKFLENSNEEVGNEVREILGMKLKMPSWMKQAISNGWTPPKDWHKKDWEE